MITDPKDLTVGPWLCEDGTIFGLSKKHVDAAGYCKARNGFRARGKLLLYPVGVWLTNTGEKPQIPDDMAIEVMFLDKGTSHTQPRALRWKKLGTGGDVVRWKIIDPRMLRPKWPAKPTEPAMHDPSAPKPEAPATPTAEDQFWDAVIAAYRRPTVRNLLVLTDVLEHRFGGRSEVRVE